jgi:hypothetical protein
MAALEHSSDHRMPVAASALVIAEMVGDLTGERRFENPLGQLLQQTAPAGDKVERHCWAASVVLTRLDTGTTPKSSRWPPAGIAHPQGFLAHHIYCH